MAPMGHSALARTVGSPPSLLATTAPRPAAAPMRRPSALHTTCSTDVRMLAVPGTLTRKLASASPLLARQMCTVALASPRASRPPSSREPCRRSQRARGT